MKFWIIAENSRESGDLAKVKVEYTEEAAKARFLMCAKRLYDVSTAACFEVEGDDQRLVAAGSEDGQWVLVRGEWFPDDGTSPYGGGQRIANPYDEDEDEDAQRLPDGTWVTWATAALV